MCHKTDEQQQNNTRSSPPSQTSSADPLSGEKEEVGGPEGLSWRAQALETLSQLASPASSALTNGEQGEFCSSTKPSEK